MQKGFTLFEMLIVMAIIVVLVAVSVPLYSYIQTSRLVDSSRQEVVEGIRTARNRALTSYNNSNHGVYLNGVAATIYQGASYAARDSSKDFIIRLATGLTFSGLGEINFQKKIGTPSATGYINLIKDTGTTRTITINNQGYIY